MKWPAGSRDLVNSHRKETNERLVVMARDDDDQEAYSELYRRSIFVARRVMFQRMRGYDETARLDMAHDSVSKALLKLHLYRGEAKYSTWLTRVLMNEAAMETRKPKRFTLSLDHRATNENGEEIDFQIADDNALTAVFEGVEQEECRVYVNAVLSGMKDTVFKKALVLRFLFEYSTTEIAEHMEISIGAVKSYLHRGLEKARKVMIETGKTKCQPCEVADKFRFADVEINNVPMCKGCAANGP